MNSNAASEYECRPFELGGAIQMGRTLAERLLEVIGSEHYTPWAHRLGFPPATVTGWIRDGRTPRPAQLALLAQKTGIPEDWWLHGEGPPPMPEGQAGSPAVSPARTYAELQEATPERRLANRRHGERRQSPVAGTIAAGQHVDPAKLAKIVEWVEKTFENERRRLVPERKAAIISLCYRYFEGREVTNHELEQFKTALG